MIYTKEEWRMINDYREYLRNMPTTSNVIKFNVKLYNIEDNRIKELLDKETEIFLERNKVW